VTIASPFDGFARRACALVVIGAALAVPSVADEEIPYFCERVAGFPSFERVAAGPDSSVCVASTIYAGDLPGQIDPPPSGQTRLVFVTVFERDGRVRWTRFLPSGWVRDLRVAPDGAIWVASYSDWDDGSYNQLARVTKLGADGAVLAEYVLRGSEDEMPHRLALLPGGDAVVVGTTASPDFTVVDAFQPEWGGETDGFVARLRGDGSGIVWSSYLGGASWDDANAVAVDADGEIFVTTRERARGDTYYPTYDADYDRDVTSVALVRMSGDGVLVSTVELPRGDFGGAYDVAALPDGRILVGGVIGWYSGGSSQGYVLPVDPATSALGVPWHEPDRRVSRISPGPGGAVLVGVDRDWYDLGTYRTLGGGFVVLAPDLATVTRRVDREELWGIRDVAFAPDGAVCIGTIDQNSALAFEEAPDDPYAYNVPVLGRLPVPGPRVPSRVHLRRVTTDGATLTWPDDGDPVVAYEVQEDVFDGNRRRFRPVERTLARPRSVRVRGLRPGATNRLRVVFEFASGQRASAAVPPVLTAPARPPRIRFPDVRAPGVLVHWGTGGNGERTKYELQRSIRLGPFEPVREEPRTFRDTWFHDREVREEDGLIQYRVRAVTTSPRAFSPWTYSELFRAR
jgi:hypothetical protein